MKARNAAGTAVGDTIFHRQNDRGPMELFRYARCRKADNAFMPTISGDNYEVLAVVGFRLGKCKLRDLLLHFLAVAIMAVQQRCELTSSGEFFFLKQLDHMLRNIHSTSGVDARADAKAYVI